MASSTSSVSKLLAQADAALRRGRLPEAIEAFTEVLAIEPALPDAWFNLAWAQRATRRFAEAAASYDRAIAEGVARPEEARLNRAVIFSDHLFDSGRARAELLAALAIEPRFVLAWLNLGNVHEDLGAVAEAEEAYRRALAIDPANGRAHARLGAIATFRGEAALAIPALHRALDMAGSINARAEILFALGAALDDTGDHDRAFQAFEAANVHARARARIRYDPARQEALVDRLIATFPHAIEPAPVQGDGAAPVFLCGMFRSGSTLAEQLLSRHEAVTAGGELEFIPALARQIAPYPEAVPALSADDRAGLRARYLGERPAGGIVTDKRCDNFLHIGLILSLFPDARIIHTIRHPLDTILSIYCQDFGDEITYGHDLADAAHYYIQYRRMMAHWAKVFGGHIHVFDYDRVVREPAGAIGEALAFLGLAPGDLSEPPPQTGAPVRTASVWQVRKPLHARSSGRWRHYERQLGAVRAMLGAAGLQSRRT